MGRSTTPETLADEIRTLALVSTDVGDIRRAGIKLAAEMFGFTVSDYVPNLQAAADELGIDVELGLPTGHSVRVSERLRPAEPLEDGERDYAEERAQAAHVAEENAAELVQCRRRVACILADDHEGTCVYGDRRYRDHAEEIEAALSAELPRVERLRVELALATEALAGPIGSIERKAVVARVAELESELGLPNAEERAEIRTKIHGRKMVL